VIIIQLGVHKSASTFLVQLIQSSISLSGGEVEYRPMARMNSTFFEQHVDFLDTRNDHVLVKTHGYLTQALEHRLAENKVKVFATYRDPRDVVLSVLDAAQVQRDQGNTKTRIAKVQSFEDALNFVRQDYDRFFKWAEVGQLHYISFDDLALNPESVISRVCNELSISVKPGVVLEKFKDKQNIRRFNKGKPDRYKSELSTDEQALVLSRFPDYQEFVSSL